MLRENSNTVDHLEFKQRILTCKKTHNKPIQETVTVQCSIVHTGECQTYGNFLMYRLKNSDCHTVNGSEGVAKD